MPRPPQDIIDIATLHTQPVETIVSLATIDLTRLWDVYAQHPALYAYVTAQAEVAQVAVVRAEQEVRECKQDIEDRLAEAKERRDRADTAYSDLLVDVFLEFARQPDPEPPAKPLPANRIEREVAQDARVRTAKKALLNANPDTNPQVRSAKVRLRALERALNDTRAAYKRIAAAERMFEHRREALNALAARANRELKN
jgi:hypothetical protein